MAHKLIQLLHGSTRDSLALQELQRMTRDGVDVVLIADIMARAHRVLRQLGLDPSDTTAEEVYLALMSAVQTEQWRTLLSGTEFVLLDVDGQIISFHPVDVINNYHHQLPLEKRRTAFAKQGLSWEITRRYKEHANTQEERVKAVASSAHWATEEPPFCQTEPDKPAVLTIGDIATEAFITLGRESVDIIGTKPRQKIALDLGARIACHNTAIQDAVGGAANAAVALARLGMQAGLMAWLGDDTASRRSLAHLRSQGIDMSGVAIKKNARSHYHYVLRHGLERTILANYENFEYRWREPACKPDWIYLGMISDKSQVLHESLLDYLTRYPEVSFAFVPGPSHFEWGAKKLAGLYARADVLILNMNEAMIVTKRPVRNVNVLLKQLLALGAKSVIITDGLKGAYATDGEYTYRIPAYPDAKDPVDRTGAGDAFAATIVAELARGRNLQEALQHAPINSMSVVGELGAQAGLLTAQQVEEYSKRAPSEYEVKQTPLV